MQGRQHPPSPLPPQEVMLREGACQVGPPPLADGASAFKISFYLPHTHTSNAGSSAPTLPRPHPPSGADTLHPPSPGGGEVQRGMPGRTSPSGRRRCMYFFLSSTHPHIQCRVHTHPPPSLPGRTSPSVPQLLKFLSIFHTPTHPMQGRQHPPSPGHTHPPGRQHPPSGTDTLHPPSREEVRFREGACQVGPPGGACISPERLLKFHPPFPYNQSTQSG